MPVIKAIIFDFFDVFRTDAYKAWLETNNIPYEGEYLDASYQLDMGTFTVKDFLQRLSDLSGRAVTLGMLDASATVDDQVVAMASRLQARYRTALLSNSPSDFIRNLLTKHDLAHLFGEIVISSEVGMVKPGPEIFEHVLRKLGVSAAETIFVDDNPAHTNAAEKLGIKSIQFHSAKQLDAELVKAGVRTG